MARITPFTGLSAALILTLGVACSDEGETTSTTTSVGVGGGTTTSTSSSGGGAVGGGASTGTTTSTSGTGGSGGAGGGTGTGGTPAFGPCHGYTDTFDAFVPAATTDYWETDDVVDVSNGMDKAVLAQPDGDLYAGLFTATPEVADNCFFSIAIENQQQEPGFYILEVLEQGDTGRKLTIEVTPGAFAVANITDAQGNGDTLGSGTLTGDIDEMRIQILPTTGVVFEVKDTSGWQTAATMATPPAWLSSPVLLGFGYRGVNGTDEGRFDDFSLSPPP